MRLNVTASIFLTSLFLAMYADADTSIQIERHVYGFKNVLAADEAAGFIHASGAAPRKVLVAAGGLAGSYNAPHDITTTAFMESAERSMVEFFDRALAMNRQRLIALRSGQDTGLTARRDPIKRAKQLLSLREQFQEARKAIVRGLPTIYGVILEGDRYQLEALNSHSSVRTHFEFDALEGAKQSVLRPSATLKPAHVRARAGISQKYAEMSDADVNKEVSMIVNEG